MYDDPCKMEKRITELKKELEICNDPNERGNIYDAIQDLNMRIDEIWVREAQYFSNIYMK